MRGLQERVAVVGGGPAGLAVARELSTAGVPVLVLERDRVVGRPVQCSGLVTERTLRLAGLDEGMAWNAIRGAIVHSPRGATYEIGGDRAHAYVMDRSAFDRRLAAQAAAAGSELWTGARVLRLERAGAGVRLTVARGDETATLDAALVVGADGPRSLVADFLGLPAPREYLRARGADVRLPHCRTSDRVHLFFGRRYAPGFFAWAIPLGGGRFRIGWGSGQGEEPAGSLRALTEDYPKIFGAMEILSQTGGLIPVGARARTSGERGLVVGDAAGQAKATSGGGLYTALLSARQAARTILEGFAGGDLSAECLSAYDQAWRQQLGAELDSAMLLRRAFRALSDADMEWALRMLRLPGMRAVVDRHGDIDYPSQLAAAVLRLAPWLLRLLPGGGEIPGDAPAPDWAISGSRG
ncbi:MAG TPA: NAD(P)/FAD-dependent oxidoreductase [Thermomicrobiaceae bacterium]|nr:NAD(P)/FAD-dependent oxidoreductase [Thermomicrobiaceae bacterium]